MYKAMMLIFAAAITASPARMQIHTHCNGTFSTQMTTPGGLLALKAVANGTNSGIVVIGQPSTMPGSMVVLNGTSPKASLSFDIDGEEYGWVVGDIGHVAGVANPVGVEKGYKEFEFTITDDGSIFHRPTAATNVWLACNRTVNDEAAFVLAWGNMGGDGGFPVGCGYTNVKQSCTNITAASYGG